MEFLIIHRISPSHHCPEPARKESVKVTETSTTRQLDIVKASRHVRRATGGGTHCNELTYQTLTQYTVYQRLEKVNKACFHCP